MSDAISHKEDITDARTVRDMRIELRAWAAHTRLFMPERVRFRRRLTEAFSADELALIIDSECERQDLADVLLNEAFGP